MSGPDQRAVKDDVARLLVLLRASCGYCADNLSVVLAVENLALACYRKGLRKPIPKPPPIPDEARKPRLPIFDDPSKRKTPLVNKRKVRG